ncbi:MAG TPA: hypothetical protein VGC21_12490 [Telluria sp.]|jgi:hypothetical protein
MEDFFLLLEWPAMLVSVAAAWWMASRRADRRVIAFWLFTIGNLMWIAWGWAEGAWGLIALNTFLMALNVRGILKNEDA